MKPLKTLTYLLITFLLFQTLLSCAQNNKDAVKTDTNIKAVAREIMSKAITSALITVDTNQRPRVRMMGSLKPETDFTVWFGTNPKSRKVEQIKQNPEITLYYQEEGNSGYVMLQGTAQLVNDAKEKEIHWKEDWKEFYPNYPDDYLLIKVTPNWIEVVSYKHNILGDQETWEPAKIVFD